MIEGVYIHPIFIHFPIAFLFLELFLLLLYYTKRNEQYFSQSIFIFKLAAVMIVPSIITGIIDAGGLEDWPLLFEDTMGDHVKASFVLSILILIRYFIYRKQKASQNLFKTQLIGSLLSVGLVAYSAHLGGKLVY